jgi:hypothetical protein
MKAKKRTRLILEAIEAGRRDRPVSYQTIDLVTGNESAAMLAIPFDPQDYFYTSHFKINLPAMGFRLVKISE